MGALRRASPVAVWNVVKLAVPGDARGGKAAGEPELL